MTETTRADKWLWAARFFKTRGLAAKACTAGKVRRGPQPLKAATGVQVGDVLEIPFPEGPGLRTVRVSRLIDQRVGAPLAQACYEDLTLPAVYEAQKEWHAARQEASKGRPTKRDRRALGKIRGFFD